MKKGTDKSATRVAGDAEQAWPIDAPRSRAAFVKYVREQGALHARDLPWRYLDDAYAVLISEVMLQQTQVVRVLGRWERFMKRFPSLDALAAAAVSDVVEEWQGLGYNRRALALKRTADICSTTYEGALPHTCEELCMLPGIGSATAAGIVAFAYRQPAIYLETNVRTVFLHELFPSCSRVADSQLIPLVRATCPPSGGDVRGWYYGLLDYGAYLKKTVTNPSRRSASYARQSSFTGSRRQKRAELLRLVLASDRGISCEDAYVQLNDFELTQGRGELDVCMFDSIVADLVKEGFFANDAGILHS